MSVKNTILDELAVLTKQAEQEGKWLKSKFDYKTVVSPDELRAANADGKLLYGPENWLLVDPNDHLTSLEKDLKIAQEKVIIFRTRLEAHKHGYK